MKKSLNELSEEIDAYFKPMDVHLAHIEHAKYKTLLLLAIVVSLAEIWIIHCVAMLGTPVWLGLFGHMTIVTILAGYALILFKQYDDCRFEAVLCLAILATGPFGAVGVILSLVVHMFSKKTHATFDEFFESLAPSNMKTQSQMIYDDILSGRDDAVDQHSIIPFLDVLSFGNDLQKRQALAKMTKHYQPDFASVFRIALNDPSNMIRVQAATAIARIESQFLKRMNKFSINQSLKNADPKMILAVAEHYDHYAYTGLLDKDNEVMNRNKALELYQQYRLLMPDDHEVCIKIGRIMMRNGDYEQACYWFRHYIDGQEKDGNVNNAVTDWYCESLYAAKHYDELRQFRATSTPVGERTDIHLVSLKDALQLWESGQYATG